jgi:hypothetical protein
MPVRQSQSCDGLPFDAVPTAPSCIAAGQISVRDLQAGTSIVATEGTLQLSFRDHSLAWLGNAVPLRSITLHEGEQFVTPQRGVVWRSSCRLRAPKTSPAGSSIRLCIVWRRSSTRSGGASPERVCPGSRGSYNA